MTCICIMAWNRLLTLLYCCVSWTSHYRRNTTCRSHASSPVCCWWITNMLALICFFFIWYLCDEKHFWPHHRLETFSMMTFYLVKTRFGILASAALSVCVYVCVQVMQVIKVCVGQLWWRWLRCVRIWSLLTLTESLLAPVMLRCLGMKEK